MKTLGQRYWQQKMKNILSALFVILVIHACNPVKAPVNTKVMASFAVSGNCEMCKETIETSLKKDGITLANWDVDAKKIKIEYDSTQQTLALLHGYIASVGYDTEFKKGDDSAYNELPDCCKYRDHSHN
jgi:copper chaperone CopZ